MSLRAERSAEEFWTPDARPDTAPTGSALFTDAVRMRPELLERVQMEHEARTAATPQRVQRLPPPAGGRPRPVVRSSVVSEVFGSIKSAQTGESFVPEPKTRAFRDSFEEFEPAKTDAPFVASLKAKGSFSQKKVFDVYYTDQFTPSMVLASWKREPVAGFKAAERDKPESYVTSKRPENAVYTKEAFNNFTNTSMAGKKTMEKPVALDLNTFGGDDAFTPDQPSDIMGMSMAKAATDGTSAKEVETIITSDAVKAALKLQADTKFKKGRMKSEFKTALDNMAPYLMPPLSKDKYKVPQGSSMFGMMAVLPTVTSTRPKLKLFLPHEMNEGLPKLITKFSFHDLPDLQVESIFGARVVPVAVEDAEGPHKYGHTLWLARCEFGAYKKLLTQGRGGRDGSTFEKTTGIYKYKRMDGDAVNFVNVASHFVELADFNGYKWLMPVALACALAIEDKPKAESDDKTDEDTAITPEREARFKLLQLVRAPPAWLDTSQEDLLALIEGESDFPDELKNGFLKDKHTDLMSLWTATMLVSEMESASKFDNVLKSGKLYQAKRENERMDAKKQEKKVAKAQLAAQKAEAKAQHAAQKAEATPPSMLNRFKGKFPKFNLKAQEASSVADLLDALAEEKLGPLQFDERPIDELVEKAL